MNRIFIMAAKLLSVDAIWLKNYNYYILSKIYLDNENFLKPINLPEVRFIGIYCQSGNFLLFKY